jgi:hypothetical protein
MGFIRSIQTKRTAGTYNKNIDLFDLNSLSLSVNTRMKCNKNAAWNTDPIVVNVFENTLKSII